jgi:hypothetical protein
VRRFRAKARDRFNDINPSFSEGMPKAKAGVVRCFLEMGFSPEIVE